MSVRVRVRGRGRVRARGRARVTVTVRVRRPPATRSAWRVATPPVTDALVRIRVG